MKYAYSPHTGEIINIETPFEWMLTTDIVPPVYDPQVAGCFFRNGAWVVEVSQQDLTYITNEIRRKRNLLLTQTDWYMVSDAPVSKSQLKLIIAYRQALRDITTQSDLTNIVWPILTLIV